MAKLQQQSSSTLKEFSETSEHVDGLQTTVHMVKVLLPALSQELANLETKMTVLRDAHDATE